MKQIRNGVFETNSSSTHSVTLEKGSFSRYDYSPIACTFYSPSYEGEVIGRREDKLGYILTCVAQIVLEPYKYTFWEKEELLLNYHYVSKSLIHSFPFVWIKEVVLEKTSFPLTIYWGMTSDESISSPFGDIVVEEENELLEKLVDNFNNKNAFKNMVSEIIFNETYEIEVYYSAW